MSDKIIKLFFWSYSVIQLKEMITYNNFGSVSTLKPLDKRCVCPCLGSLKNVIIVCSFCFLMEKDGRHCKPWRDLRGAEHELHPRGRWEFILHPPMKARVGEDKKLVRGKDNRRGGGQ